LNRVRNIDVGSVKIYPFKSDKDIK
jgi:hypothetical protein